MALKEIWYKIAPLIFWKYTHVIHKEFADTHTHQKKKKKMGEVLAPCKTILLNILTK
jgi:hypothetical protein